MSRWKRKSGKKTAPIPRIAKCDYCNGAFDLNGFGWLVNGSGATLCGHDCFMAYWRRSERIRKGEASWEDI